MSANNLTLWPHQKSAIAAAHAAMRSGRPSGLWSMPTGSGKTVAFASFAADLKIPTLAMVHRDELIGQTVRAFGTVWPAASVGVVKAERNEIDGHDVVIASVQSLHERRLAGISRDRFGLVIADEAHHAVADTWAAVLDHFQARFVLGVTATPERADGKGLADRFGAEPIYSYPLRQAIDDGHLCNLVQYALETTVELDDVTYRAGDFTTRHLSESVNTPERNRIVVESFEDHAEDRRAVAFCVDIEHAENLRDAFIDANIDAATVTGNTPTHERRQLLADFAAGHIQVVTNCAVLTEGFDDPGISCVLMARPTCSRSLYTQCVGRGLRLAPGKIDCLILDFVDNSKRHKLVTVLDLFGAPQTKNANGFDVLEVADRDIAEAEERHVIESQAPLTWRLSSVCPWPEVPSLKGYAAGAWWHTQPATDKQIDAIRRRGMLVERTLTKGEASFLLDRVADYESAYPSPASSKQAYYLRSQGAWREGMTKREASALIGKLKNPKRVGV